MADNELDRAQPTRRMQPLIVVDDVEPLRPFYTEKLGFSERTYRPHGDGAFVSFEYESCPIGFCTPGALPEIPSEGTRGLMVMYELRDAAAAHRVMSGRAGEALGPIKEAAFGLYYDVVDPAGVVVRFVQVTE
jgi:predicted enzyme related to lactoylglutathione lyase